MCIAVCIAVYNCVYIIVYSIMYSILYIIMYRSVRRSFLPCPPVCLHPLCIHSVFTNCVLLLSADMSVYSVHTYMYMYTVCTVYSVVYNRAMRARVW